MKHKEPGIFTDFDNGMVSKKFCHILMKWNQRGPILYSAAEFLGHAGQKILKRVDNTEEKFMITGIQA